MPEGTGGGRGRGRGLSRGRGRGRSRRGGRGGGGGNNGNKGGDSTTPTKASSKGNNDSKKPNEQTPTKAPRVDPIEEKMRLMGDQDVLIAFGPFIRAGNQDAVRVHQQYLSNNKQIEFINNARQFLIGQERRANETKPILPVEAKTVAEIEAAHGNNNSTQKNAPHDVMQPNLPTLPPGLLTPQKLPSLPPGLTSPQRQQQQPQQQPPQHHQGGIQNNNNMLRAMPVGLGHNTNVLPPGPPPGMPPGMGLPPPQNNTVSQINRPPGMPPPMRPTAAPAATEPMSSLPKPSSSILPAPTPAPVLPPKESKTEPDTTPAVKTPAKPTKQWRIQTRCEEQPGDSAQNKPTSLIARTRSELTARWVLPLPYLRNRAIRRFEELKNAAEESKVTRPPPQNLTIRDALKTLTVGLFRRGAMDNGASSSIVSKEILCADSKDGPDKDYFFNIDQRTDTVFGTVPFYAPRTPGNVVFRLYFEDEPHTNGMSSLSALATVFEMFKPRRTNANFNDAGRMAWGCVCEARKVVEQAAQKFVNQKEEIEERLEAIKIKEELPDLKSLNVSGGDNETKKEEDENDDTDAKNDAIMKDKFTNERKWREMQHAYSSILQAVVSNKYIHLLMKRDLLSTMRLEYELWCPLCDAFAPIPFVKTKFEASKMPGNVSAFPYPAGKDHYQMCRSSKEEMQQTMLGFVPQVDNVGEIARGGKKGRDFFLDLSSAMNEMYTNEYAVSEKVWRRREQVRAAIEQVMSNSREFPPGTKVAVFGSSANGFGSPNSDLDLCLSIPASAADFTNDGKGVEAMTNLASKFTAAGMRDVNTERLTARIPIVKFNVPYNDNGTEILVECDLSLQNPLALLNTSLLRTYATISPMSCVLASIIKRWAKSRDINNPSKHTLSSYGYVLMLTYFLKNARRGDGNPILPNLQWVDPQWAQNPTNPQGLEGLQKYCADNNGPSTIGVLLASFFHYFAYTFDYKKHVVSLGNKLVEKEVKAEEDGWSVYKSGLAIEDPFELFYDVAHVVKANNFLHIKKEFALAYSKIANEAQSKRDIITGKELIDMICEPVSQDEGRD
ncbi:terminal uridilyltransferase [Skeletonema marinoi]|uniref:Terminal uridilyltransferase n=1 Tax=Skeletonema marinoi TaxID=267567 RepID=A0AAD8Y0K5_9STRA|nr:terminal uridilyltransferase [Skeletonema marinoi]